jgi:hypothetical protein
MIHSVSINVYLSIYIYIYIYKYKLFYLKEKPSFSNISTHYFDLLQTLALKETMGRHGLGLSQL